MVLLDIYFMFFTPRPRLQGMLLGLRREENKRENARLRDELDSLKTEFAQKVCTV